MLNITQITLEFTAAIPAMETELERVFLACRRRWAGRQLDDLMSDGIGACWRDWIVVVQSGRDPLEVGPRGIANRSAMYTLNGRNMGGFGSRIRSVDSTLRTRSTDVVLARGHHEHISFLADARRTSPADQAAFNIDTPAWLATLNDRQRRVAQLLSIGEKGIDVARAEGISPGRVTQLRDELHASYVAFHAQADSLV